MHPLSIAELAHARVPKVPIQRPKAVPEAEIDALLRFGGYPEAFRERDARFHRRWVDLRRQQLVREDIRDLTRVQELGQIESLLRLLHERSGSQLIYSTLASEIRVAVETVRRCLDTLASDCRTLRIPARARRRSSHARC